MRKMGIGLGVGINRSNYAQGIFNAYSARVVADGGVVESGSCVDAVSSLLQSASLLLIPSGYKGGKLYAEIPTNGNGDLTWTRGSDAFRTNVSGVLQRVPWNLLSWSEDLTNASWSKSNATITGDNTLAPNGTLTADLVSFSTSSGYVLKTQSVAPATQYTFSAYFKNNTFASGETILFRLSDGVIAPAIATINLVAKTATYNTNPSAWTNLSGTIEQLPNDWFRVAVTATSVNGGSGWIEVTNGSTKSCFVWGVQLVTSSTAQTYLPTTDRLNFPRLSYMYGSCPSALLEPQRTNLALWSEDITNTGGWTLNNVTATSNTTTAPNGTTTADTLTATASTASHNIVTVSRLPATYTGSIYAKKGTHNFLQIWDGSSSSAFANFNLNTGVIGTVGTLVTAAITNVGDGWYRCSISFTASGGSAFRYAMVSSSSAAHNESWTANGTETIFLWGGQTEVGAYPTTYIPTTGSATATRVADSAVKTGISSLIGQTEGTVYLQANLQKYSETGFVVAIGDGTLANSIYLQRTATNGLDLYCRKSGNTDVVLSVLSANWTAGNNKIAIAYGSTSFEIYINGVSQGSASFVGLPSMSQYTVGSRPDNLGTLVATGHYQQMALFTTRLSASNLTTLTTL